MENLISGIFHWKMETVKDYWLPLSLKITDSCRLMGLARVTGRIALIVKIELKLNICFQPCISLNNAHGAQIHKVGCNSFKSCGPECQ